MTPHPRYGIVELYPQEAHIMGTGARMLDKVYKLARWLSTRSQSYRRQTRRVSANLRRAA